MSFRLSLLLALAVVFVFLLPLSDLLVLRRVKQHTSAAARLRFYRFVIAYAWLSSAAAFFLLGRDWTAPFHQTQPRWTHSPQIAAPVSVLLAAYLFLSFRVGFKTERSAKVRQRLAKHMGLVRFFLPVSLRERRWFVALSLTAGTCEEFLYRGYLMVLLHSFLHLPLAIAFLIMAAAFGFAHLYQGARGMVQTTLGGVLFGLLALLSGGLWLPMIIHSLMDLQLLLMYQPLRDNPRTAASLISGANPQAAEFSAGA